MSASNKSSTAKASQGPKTPQPATVMPPVQASQGGGKRPVAVMPPVVSDGKRAASVGGGAAGSRQDLEQPSAPPAFSYAAALSGKKAAPVTPSQNGGGAAAAVMPPVASDQKRAASGGGGGGPSPKGLAPPSPRPAGPRVLRRSNSMSEAHGRGGVFSKGRIQVDGEEPQYTSLHRAGKNNVTAKDAFGPKRSTSESRLSSHDAEVGSLAEMNGQMAAILPQLRPGQHLSMELHGNEGPCNGCKERVQNAVKSWRGSASESGATLDFGIYHSRDPHDTERGGGGGGGSKPSVPTTYGYHEDAKQQGVLYDGDHSLLYEHPVAVRPSVRAFAPPPAKAGSSLSAMEQRQPPPAKPKQSAAPSLSGGGGATARSKPDLIKPAVPSYAAPLSGQAAPAVPSPSGGGGAPARAKPAVPSYAAALSGQGPPAATSRRGGGGGGASSSGAGKGSAQKF